MSMGLVVPNTSRTERLTHTFVLYPNLICASA
jgi:hypothetical protein